MNCTGAVVLKRFDIHASQSGNGQCLLFPLTSQLTLQKSFEALCWLSVADSVFTRYEGLRPGRWCEVGAKYLSTKAEVMDACTAGMLCDHEGDLQKVLSDSPLLNVQELEVGDLDLASVSKLMTSGGLIAFVWDQKRHAGLLVGWHVDGEVVSFDPLGDLVTESLLYSFSTSSHKPILSISPRGVARPAASAVVGALNEADKLEIHKEFLAINHISLAVDVSPLLFSPILKEKEEKDEALLALAEFTTGSRARSIESLNLSGSITTRSIDWRVLKGSLGREEEVTERRLLFSDGKLIGTVDFKRIGAELRAVKVSSGQQAGRLTNALKRALELNPENLELIEVPGLGAARLVLDFSGITSRKAIPLGPVTYGFTAGEMQEESSVAGRWKEKL